MASSVIGTSRSRGVTSAGIAASSTSGPRQRGADGEHELRGSGRDEPVADVEVDEENVEEVMLEPDAADGPDKRAVHLRRDRLVRAKHRRTATQRDVASRVIAGTQAHAERDVHLHRLEPVDLRG